MSRAADVKAILASDLFDLGWYRERCPMAPAVAEAAALHFLEHGLVLGLDPGPGFSMRRYLRANPDVAAAGMDPLLHYLRHGREEGRAIFAVDDGAEEDARPLPDPAGQARALELLRDSPLFDPDFYLDRYPDVRAAGADPLQHFVEHGAGEGRWPNPWFDPTWYRSHNQERGDGSNSLVHYAESAASDTAWTSQWFDGGHYRACYRDVADAGMTPLEHFLCHGVDSGREARALSPIALEGRIPDLRTVHATVVIAVHDAADHVQACLDGVLRHTRFGEGDKLLVIDDASNDPAITGMLRRLEGRKGVQVIRNQHNLGYTRTANLGCRLTGDDDVVLLNSDTLVGPHWLRNLKIAACRRTRIGTVTAVSDNAGAFSVPHEGGNELRQGVSVETLSRAVADADAADFEVPTGNGFCMYLRRTMLESVGGFDEDAFPFGYGEENDLCMRALHAGWHHLVAPKVFVHHARSASFGERRGELVRSGTEQMQQLHPDYPVAAAGISGLRGFVLARYRIARRLRALANGGSAPRTRILYVLSTDNGGIPHSNSDLMRALDADFDCMSMRCDGRVIEVSMPGPNGNRIIERHPLAEPIGLATHVSEEYEAIVRDLLFRHSIDLLHIRHLAWHSLNLADVAHGMGVAVVQSLHDYYAVCPTVNLLDRLGELHPHGVEENAENALWPLDPAASVPMDSGRLRMWQRRMQHALLAADVLVTTSASARDVLLDALPGLVEAGVDIQVIAHGRDFERFEALAEPGPVTSGDPLRILLPGNIGLHKGRELVRKIKQIDAGGGLEFHLLGTTDADLGSAVVNHGPYQREEFAGRVAAIHPHLAVVLSLAPETWCHTLTECWAAGLPVLAIDRGAVGDRIREHGGGWLVDSAAGPEAIHAKLMALRDLAGERQAKIDEVRSWQRDIAPHRTTAWMAEHYTALYRRVLLQRCVQ
jgi:GT2 family glycosyltransferase